MDHTNDWRFDWTGAWRPGDLVAEQVTGDVPGLVT